jgi:hypothetical protein
MQLQQQLQLQVPPTATQQQFLPLIMNQQIFIGVLLWQRLEESERDLLHEPKQDVPEWASVLFPLFDGTAQRE